MKKSKIANWLFYYYLSSTALLGTVLILFGSENSFLALKDYSAVFSVLIPVLTGQLTILFQWRANQAFRSNHELDKEVNISPSAVIASPIVVTVLFLLAIFLRGFGILYDWKYQVSESQFRNLIVFVLTILIVTTVYLVILFYHPSSSDGSKS